MQFGPYCQVETKQHEHTALAVRPKQTALEAILKHTIIVDNDRMSWQIIQWDDKRALVVCHHSLIIGDIWVAIIDPKTIPAK